MKISKFSIITLFVCCFMSCAAWASSKAVEKDGRGCSSLYALMASVSRAKSTYQEIREFESFFGILASGPFGCRVYPGKEQDPTKIELRDTIVYSATLSEITADPMAAKDFRLTNLDYLATMLQASELMFFLLMEQKGKILLKFFAQPEILELIIRKGQTFFPKAAKKEDKPGRGNFVILQLLAHHTDELEFGKNNTLQRMIFQCLRLFYLSKDIFETPQSVYNAMRGLKSITILKSTDPDYWDVEKNDEVCISMYKVFVFLRFIYDFAFDPKEKDFIERILTPEEKVLIDSQMAMQQ